MAASTGIHSSLCRLVFDFKAYDLNSQKMILNSGNWFKIAEFDFEFRDLNSKSQNLILNSGAWIQNHRKWFWNQGFEFKIAEFDFEFRDLNSKSLNLILNSVIWIQNHRLWYFEIRVSVVWIQGHNRLQAQILLLSWKFMIEHHIIHMHIYNSMCSCSVWYTCKVLVYTSPVEWSHVITACKWWAAANGSGKPVYHWRHTLDGDEDAQAIVFEYGAPARWALQCILHICT